MLVFFCLRLNGHVPFGPHTCHGRTTHAMWVDTCIFHVARTEASKVRNFRPDLLNFEHEGPWDDHATNNFLPNTSSYSFKSSIYLQTCSFTTLGNLSLIPVPWWDYKRELLGSKGESMCSKNQMYNRTQMHSKQLLFYEINNI